MPQSPRRGRINAPLADTGSSAIHIHAPRALPACQPHHALPEPHIPVSDICGNQGGINAAPAASHRYPVGGAFMRPWPIPAPQPYALMRPWPILAPQPYAFMRPWPTPAPWLPIHFDTTAGQARGDRKGTRRPADRPRHPWRGRLALHPGLYRPASPIAHCQNPIFPYRISAETRAALMPPLRRATVTPVGGAFMRPWPIPAPLPYAFMCPWPILAPWPVLNREFQAIKKPRRRAA